MKEQLFRMIMLVMLVPRLAFAQFGFQQSTGQLLQPKPQPKTNLEQEAQLKKDIERKAARVTEARKAAKIANKLKEMDDRQNQAKLKCASLLTIKEVNNILDPKIYIDDCTYDAVLSGSFNSDAKERYLTAVRRVELSALNESSKSESKSESKPQPKAELEKRAQLREEIAEKAKAAANNLKKTERNKSN